MSYFSSLRLFRLCFTLFLVNFYSDSVSQESEFTIPKQTELAIPPSPAYQMLDAGSSLVSSPGVIRDFKVDWSFRTYRLAPNIAIEAQPIWSIFYNRPTVEKYQKAGAFMQMLSTLSVSAGSFDANDSIRLLSWAGKLTIYRQYDPLNDPEWFEDLSSDYESQKQVIDAQLIELKNELKKSESRLAKDSIELLISQNRMNLESLKNSQKSRIKELQETLKSKYWNQSAIDVAYGKSYSFNRTLTERIDSIKTRNFGNALWVNAAFGIGRKVLVTGHIRSEQIKIIIPDSGKTTIKDFEVDPFSGDTTIIERDSLFVNFPEARKNILSLGINIRFGSPRYNFFMEAFYTKSKTPTFEDTNWESWSGYGEGGRRRKAEIKEEILFAFGGEWKITNSVLLSYGIRTQIDEHLKFRNIIPLASISCLMR